MKIVLSRKGFDDKYGGYPSIIWPETREMLSFPIPVEPPEKGTSADRMFFKGRALSDIFKELEVTEFPPDQEFHLDPEIQNLTGKFTYGALGQSGAALQHLKNENIGKGDFFLFFGTFCETNLYEKTLRYAPMHSFHAIWGYLVVDGRIDNVDEVSDRNHPELLRHPHVVNRNVDQYKKGNAIFFGQDYGTFKYGECLRLTKIGYQKSYWSLPAYFAKVSMTYNENSARAAPWNFGPPQLDRNSSSTIQKGSLIHGSTRF